MRDLNFCPQQRHITELGVTDFFTGTAGCQALDALSEGVVDIASALPPKAFFTLSMTDGRSAGATVGGPWGDGGGLSGMARAMFGGW